MAADPPTRRQQAQGEDAPEAWALNVLDKGELGDAESFLDPGAMVVCTTTQAGGPMWGRQTRVSRSSKRRYPYASVHDWCGGLGVSTRRSAGTPAAGERHDGPARKQLPRISW